MITEFFVSLGLGILDFLIGWLPDDVEVTMPDFGPLFGIMRSLDAATAGFISESFDAAVVVLTVTGVLFLYGVLRQLLSHVPFIGGR